MNEEHIEIENKLKLNIENAIKIYFKQFLNKFDSKIMNNDLFRYIKSNENC